MTTDIGALTGDAVRFPTVVDAVAEETDADGKAAPSLHVDGLGGEPSPRPSPWEGEGVSRSEPRTGTDLLRSAFVDCADALYRFIVVRVAGDRHAADEILQQCCVEAARHARPPRAAEAYPPWLMGIARNLIRKHWRDRRRTRRTAERQGRPGNAALLAEQLCSTAIPPEAGTDKELIALLQRAVTALPAADQDLIYAHYFDGRSCGRIAAEWGTTEKSVESRLYRARGRLREILRRMGISGEP